MSKIEIYTDGSFYHSSRKSGYGVFSADFPELCACGPVVGATSSIETEYKAVEVALQLVLDLKRTPKTVQILSDLDVMVNLVNGRWRPRRGSKLVFTLIKSIRELLDKFKDLAISFKVKWVKAHAGNPGNEAADCLAKWGRLSLSCTSRLAVSQEMSNDWNNLKLQNQRYYRSKHGIERAFKRAIRSAVSPALKLHAQKQPRSVCEPEVIDLTQPEEPEVIVYPQPVLTQAVKGVKRKLSEEFHEHDTHVEKKAYFRPVEPLLIPKPVDPPSIPKPVCLPLLPRPAYLLSPLCEYLLHIRARHISHVRRNLGSNGVYFSFYPPLA